VFPEQSPERVRARLDDREVSMLIADDGELAGFSTCGISRDRDVGREIGEIWSFFVAVSRWRAGIGRALMAAVLDDLRERGYAEASVWSFAANDRANEFYEAQGFTRDGAERREDVWANELEVRLRRALP